MQVKFATINTDPLLLDKSGAFVAASPVEKTVQISNPANVENPHFILDIPAGGTFEYNYCYIQKWGRYYFLGEPTYLDGNRLTVSGVCDVLTTYADDIRNLDIIVNRTESVENTKIPDALQASQANRQSEILNFKDSPFSVNFSTDIVYVLTVQGGSHRNQPAEVIPND